MDVADVVAGHVRVRDLLADGETIDGVISDSRLDRHPARGTYLSYSQNPAGSSLCLRRVRHRQRAR